MSAIAEEDIRFPVGYQPLKSVLEENLETIKIKAKLDEQANSSVEDKLLVIKFDTPLIQQAEIISSAKEMCKLKNCYINYKKMVRPQAETFLIHKQQKKEEGEKTVQAIVEQIRKQSIKDQRLMRIAK